MRHSVFGKQLSRTKNERRRLLQGLARDLINRGSITTTLAKAKAVQPMVEKLVTKAKKNSNGSLESIKRTLSDWGTTRVLLADTKERFAKRSSGFTRIIKLGQRAGDGAIAVSLQFVDARIVKVETPKTTETLKALPQAQKTSTAKNASPVKKTVSRLKK